MTILAATVENSVDLINISILNAAIVAVLGYVVVFVGLIALQLVIMAMGKYFIAKDQKAAETAAAAKVTMPANVPPVAAAPAVVPMAAPAASTDPAPGTAGKVKIYDVPPKTAAMIMAIVANKMGKPLNELRFISIKEVK
ncbi:MAG: OadG family protein [Oscillospiraceae bacterium]|nr:OadG family protein [Oscillospiraceae bacterium]